MVGNRIHCVKSGGDVGSRFQTSIGMIRPISVEFRIKYGVVFRSQSAEGIVCAHCGASERTKQIPMQNPSRSQSGLSIHAY